MSASVVRFLPEEVGPMVTMHACWSADNGYETAVFPTKDEAVLFCRRRWHSEPVIVPAEDGES